MSDGAIFGEMCGACCAICCFASLQNFCVTHVPGYKGCCGESAYGQKSGLCGSCCQRSFDLDAFEAEEAKYKQNFAQPVAEQPKPNAEMTAPPSTAPVVSKPEAAHVQDGAAPSS